MPFSRFWSDGALARSQVRVLKDKLKWMAVWKLEKEHQESQGKYEAHQEQLVRMNEGLARLTEPRR